jgi:RND superfamily putative drug exporter
VRNNRRWAWRAGIAAVLIGWLLLGAIGGPTVGRLSEVQENVPILFLAQIAFMVGFGVLLDTTVVRSLLVPALSYDLGARIWWPSKLSHAKEEV